VRRLGHLGYGLTDLQSSTGRQAVDGEIKVNDQLITGKLPTIPITRDGREHPAVHQCDLPEWIGCAVR
jgi:hypothetical protein